jgi:hypothetical protein
MHILPLSMQISHLVWAHRTVAQQAPTALIVFDTQLRAARRRLACPVPRAG